MTLCLIEIRNEFEKVLKAIQDDRSLLCKCPKYPKTTGYDNKKITAENLADLAGNHLFDDQPKWFGISKLEGHNIRAYFQGGCINGYYNFVPELHREFPDVFDEERQEYLNKINERRVNKGLEPISL